jgi:hypothetical protein
MTAIDAGLLLGFFVSCYKLIVAIENRLRYQDAVKIRRQFMGETSELMLEGVLCQICGGYMDDLETKMIDGKEHIVEVPGFPRTCPSCKKRERKKKYGKPKKNR